MGNPIGLAVVLSIASIIVSALQWKLAADQIPVFWNLHEQPILLAPKWLGLFALPLLVFIVPYIIYQFAARDAKLEKQGSEAKHAAAHIIVLPGLFLFFVHIFIVLEAATSHTQYFNSRIFTSSIALWLFIWLGYNVQYVQLNSTIGILTPWTVSDGGVWKQTQTHATGVLILFGLVLLIVSLVVPLGLAYFITTLILCLLPYPYLFIYSYAIKRSPEEITEPLVA